MKVSNRVTLAAAVLSFVLALSPGASQALSETILHSFTGGTDGESPFAGLLSDNAGSFYGVTGVGGSCPVQQAGCGTVFKLSQSGGKWTKTTIYSFQGGNADGMGPVGSPVMDKLGNIYGTTQYGGIKDVGTVFKLSQSGGKWTETIIHAFAYSLSPPITLDGDLPYGDLYINTDGSLLGTTVYGGSVSSCGNGSPGCGTVFKLTPPTGSGPWTETILYRFTGGSDGAQPFAGVIPDARGNLYGTAASAGANDCGTAFKLSLSGSNWTQTVLHTFKGGSGPGCSGSSSDGAFPLGGLYMDAQGSLYGTTDQGGQSGAGTVYELSGAGWTESILHSFQGGSDGIEPRGTLIVNSKGALLGTTLNGGNTTACGGDGCGTAFSLTQNNGQWTKNTLYTFQGGSDGAHPNELTFGTDGALYGSTTSGGGSTACTDGCGTAYKLK